MSYAHKVQVTDKIYAQRIRALENLKDRIFDLVCKQAPKERWAEWLRVPLEHAAAEGEVELVHSLVAAGACVDAPDFTVGPLHLALHRSTNEPVVQALLDRGACLHRRDNKGNTPLHLVANLGYDCLLSPLLLKRAHIECVDLDGRTPLLVAAEKGRVFAARVLLEAKANVDVRDYKGHSALELAIHGGHARVMRELLQHGVDPIPCSEYTLTPLQIAAKYNQPDAVDVLIEAGAKVEGDEDSIIYPYVPLRMAAEGGCCAAMLALLQRKADVNAQDISGRWPLHAASRKVQPEAVELLLRWGADKTNVDNGGQRAAEMIGAGLKKKKRLAKADAMQRVLNMLILAPAERAWRRRGLMVMCRAFWSNDWLGFASNPTAGSIIELMGRVDDIQFSTAINSSCATRKSEVNKSDAKADGGQEGTVNMEIYEGAVCSSLCNVEAWVVGLEQDDLFRLIVSFL